MDTIYFQQFMSQLTAVGHKKADGYDLSLFRKMLPLELAEAERLLISGLNEGDWNGINALCTIGSTKAIDALKNIFPKISDDRFLKFKLALYLFNKTKDNFYKNYLNPDFIKYDETDRISYIICIPNLEKNDEYQNILLKIALDDKSKICRFYAGISLLKIKHLIESEDKIESFRPLLSELADADEKVRLIATQKLSKLPTNSSN